MTDDNPVSRAVRMLGTQSQAATVLRTTQQNISRMIRKGRASAVMALRLEAAVKGAVTRYELCPSLSDNEVVR